MLGLFGACGKQAEQKQQSPLSKVYCNGAESEGFKELKWGATIEEAKEKGLLVGTPEVRGNQTFFDGKSTTIGDIKVEVTYVFYGNEFGLVFTTFRTIQNFNTLRNGLVEKYGQPHVLSPFNYHWYTSLEHGEGTSIGLEFDGTVGNLTYVWNPIAHKVSKKTKGDL